MTSFEVIKNKKQKWIGCIYLALEVDRQPWRCLHNTAKPSPQHREQIDLDQSVLEVPKHEPKSKTDFIKEKISIWKKSIPIWYFYDACLELGVNAPWIPRVAQAMETFNHFVRTRYLHTGEKNFTSTPDLWVLLFMFLKSQTMNATR